MIGRTSLLRTVLQQGWHYERLVLLPCTCQRRCFSAGVTPLLEKSAGRSSRFVYRGVSKRTSAIASSTTSATSHGPVGDKPTPETAAARVVPSATTASTAAAASETKTATPEETDKKTGSASSATSLQEGGQPENLKATAETPQRQTQQQPPESAQAPGETAGVKTTPSPPPPSPPRPQGGIQLLFASWQQGVVASIGAVMGIGFIVYLLYTPVKEDTVHHTAVVASEALGDIRLRGKALQLSKDIVLSVLQDEQSLKLVVELVRKLLAQEDTKVAISSLLQSLFEDHYTQEVTKKFVLMIVRDPWIMDQLQVIVKEQVLRLLADEGVKKALSKFLTESASKSLGEPELQYETARAVRRSLVSVVNPWS